MNLTKELIKQAQEIVAAGKNVWVVADGDKVISVHHSRDKAKEAGGGKVSKFEGALEIVKEVVREKKQPKEQKEKKITKRQMALELLANAEDKTRGAMVKLFGEKLGMSTAMASTYYYTMKSIVEGNNA